MHTWSKAAGFALLLAAGCANCAGTREAPQTIGDLMSGNPRLFGYITSGPNLNQFTTLEILIQGSSYRLPQWAVLKVCVYTQCSEQTIPVGAVRYYEYTLSPMSYLELDPHITHLPVVVGLYPIEGTDPITGDPIKGDLICGWNTLLTLHGEFA